MLYRVYEMMIWRNCTWKETTKKLGNQEPQGDRALIFDDGKVACQFISECKRQTSYILQFL